MLSRLSKLLFLHSKEACQFFSAHNISELGWKMYSMTEPVILNESDKNQKNY